MSELTNINLINFVRNNKYHNNDSEKQFRINESNVEFQKIIIPNQYTTYIYKIATYDAMRPSIKHLIITKDLQGVEKACYAVYTPSKYTFNLNLKNFSGKLETFTLENELLSSTNYRDGIPSTTSNRQGFDTEACFNITTIRLITCSGGGHHGVGIPACVPQDAFYSVSTTVVCIDTPTTINQIIAPTEYASGGGGGNGFEGIDIPEIYTGEPDANNLDFIFALQVSTFTNTLPAETRNVMTQNWWIYPNIVHWMKNNGGLTAQNKAFVTFALMNVSPVLNLYNLPSFTIVEMNQLYYNSFMFLLANPTPEAAIFVNQFALNCNINHELKLDFDDSWRSPANIDRSSITNATPEGIRFNEIYDKLKDVSEFKALFTDIFDGPQSKLNVKFEMRENLFETAAPFRPVAGKCVPNGNNNYLILINKQTLLPLTGTLPSNKLENAQTIIHEATHAYLRNLLSNPNAVATIPNINELDLKGILAALKVLNPNYHNIMFDKLTKAMEKIVKSLKEILTTPEKRAVIESYTINESQTSPYNPQPWNWDTYFRYLSFEGLEDTPGFQALFPTNSDALNKYTLYINYGRAILNY